MKDCKGNYFTTGSKLKSLQSPRGCGIVVCTHASGDVAVLKQEEEWLAEKAISIDQKSLENSFWEVI